ncbi:MAG: efflux RND transporter periplasmic adaptor subunit [Saprospiraceae bacterium]|nr:efflux RND transporter periplasmic adaptor subunit [Saprospiraceae bacterium]
MFRNSLLLVFILLFISSCSRKKEEVSEEVLRPVKYGMISLTSDALRESFSGTAQSSKETKLSFKVSGKVNSIGVKVGDVVRTGQPIARIDETDYNVQYEQSKANMKSVETQIKSANSQLINSRANYLRVEKLYENNSVSLSEYEAAKSAYELAQASYDASLAQASASERQVESAKNQVTYSNLTAPYTGVITSLMVEENELVNAGTPIVTISSMINPEISVGVPEKFISRVSKDQHVDISLSSLPGETFEGHVYEVGFSSMGGSTYPVTIRIDKPIDDLRPGMAADVHFNFGAVDLKEKLIAPVAAVGEDNTGNFVFALEAEEEHFIARKVNVDVGNLTPSGFQVECGLEKGDLVATAGLSIILDGMKVRLMDPKQ